MITKWPTRVVKISTLVDHPENPRVPISEDEDFHASLKGSLDAFGYAQHIVWNERTGYVVSGHQRLQLLREAGETDVEVIAVDYDNDTERAALLAFNRIHGRFKDKELADLLAKLDKDMKARTGFSGDEIKRLLRAMAMRSRDPNDVPETPTPVTRPGDLIILGDHRLLCGDSTKREDVARLMDGEMTTMVFTDPPYNCNYGASMAPSKQSRTRKSSTLGSGRGGAVKNSAIANDNMPTEAWREFCLKLYEIYKEFCSGDIYQWGASGPDGMRSRTWLVEEGCHWSATIIWVKDSTVMSPANYHRQYEPCFYGWFDKSSFVRPMKRGNDRTGLSEVWTAPKPNKSELHPTMKPVEICERGISNSSKQGDIVLDLFGGSGSTLIACERLDRRCRMMELDPHYCDVIVARWEQLTGQQAVRPGGADGQ